MLSSQCVSITDLKKDTSKLIKSLKDEWYKVIFVNNKPVAILVDIDNFDLSINEPFDFDFWSDGVNPRDLLDQLATA